MKPSPPRPTCPECGRGMVRRRDGTLAHPRLSLAGWVWHARLYGKNRKEG